MTPTKLNLYLLIFTLLLNSCFSSIHRESGKIFHAAPPTSGIGALYFGLYNDGTYQICNSGGLGQDCYSDDFKLEKDTLTLLNLSKDVPLASNRLLIRKYDRLDSNYWKWKYKGNSHTWQEMQRHDTILALGDVYQLDSHNNLMSTTIDNHFSIVLDNLKDYHEK